MIRRFLGPQRPDDLTDVADLVMRCCEGDSTLALELPSDLPVEDLLVAFDDQHEFGNLLCELSENARRFLSACT